jgi:hypothetical protein
LPLPSGFAGNAFTPFSCIASIWSALSRGDGGGGAGGAGLAKQQRFPCGGSNGGSSVTQDPRRL